MASTGNLFDIGIIALSGFLRSCQVLSTQRILFNLLPPLLAQHFIRIYSVLRLQEFDHLIGHGGRATNIEYSRLCFCFVTNRARKRKVVNAMRPCSHWHFRLRVDLWQGQRHERLYGGLAPLPYLSAVPCTREEQFDTIFCPFKTRHSKEVHDSGEEKYLIRSCLVRRNFGRV
jgi:hypothetical protein